MKMGIVGVLSPVAGNLSKGPLEGPRSAELTTNHHGHIIGDNSKESRDAPWRVDMGNVG